MWKCCLCCDNFCQYTVAYLTFASFNLFPRLKVRKKQNMHMKIGLSSCCKKRCWSQDSSSILDCVGFPHGGQAPGSSIHLLGEGVGVLQAGHVIMSDDDDDVCGWLMLNEWVWSWFFPDEISMKGRWMLYSFSSSIRVQGEPLLEDIQRLSVASGVTPIWS